jgi:hypothetical protein
LEIILREEFCNYRYVWYRQIPKAGQRGRVVSIPKHMTGKVGVKFDKMDNPSDNTSKDEKKTEETQKGHNLIEWCDCEFLKH